ncbi:MAG: BrnT family toxin, partial [Bacteroidota bacterium]
LPYALWLTPRYYFQMLPFTKLYYHDENEVVVIQTSNLMPNFEWDDKKNESNKEKHGLSFEQGSKVFNDENRLQNMSLRGSERSYFTIGKAFKVLITVVYTIRDLTFRIISVRRSRKDEREAYLTNSLSKQGDDYE